MIVYRMEGSTSTKIHDRLILELRDLEKVWGIPNKNFPLVIIARVGKFDISRILVDDGSSYNIMYSELFEKMDLNWSNLLSYEGPDLR